jgi:hypothetical protein
MFKARDGIRIAVFDGQGVEHSVALKVRIHGRGHPFSKGENCPNYPPGRSGVTRILTDGNGKLKDV